MAELTDIELLRDYGLRNSESAFATLVQRHIRLVYSVAFRQLGNTHQAEEVTQAVFIILARKAAGFPGDTPLSGWLYQAARLTTANLVRSEQRRFRREQEAHMRSEIHEPQTDPVWQGLAPFLDEAMGQLSARERDAIVVRYFEGRSFSEAAIALGSNEAAIQKRVGRGVEKLRVFFARRGVKLSATTLVGLVAANSLQSAPAGLTASVTASAVLKGAAASGRILTLIKGALKLMAWTKAKAVMVVAAVALLATGTATVTVKVIEAKTDEATQIQVLEIVETNTFNYLADDTELEKIEAIGPKAFPTLANLIEWRENLPGRQYEKVWPFLPASLKKEFKTANVRQRMHEKAVQIVYELGPVATRPLNGALCRALDESDWQATIYALRALYWSIPESTNSVEATINWLSDPTRQHLFGITLSDELWPDLPQTAPLLTECLRNPYLAREAAGALGIIGTNAFGSVPALIEVCDRGVAEPPLELKYTQNYQSPDEPELMNRQAAFDALGKIGDASPKVIAAIERGLNDKNEPVRFAALRSLAALHQPLVGRLASKLKTFTSRRSYNFQKIIDWTGTLGQGGRDALPWLEQFTISNSVQNLPQGDNKVNGEWPEDPDYFRLSAIVAICKIDPRSTLQYLPDLVEQIGRRWEPVELLTNSPVLKSEIIAQLEPVLNDTNGIRSAIAAYVILGLEPKHPGALSALRDRVAQGTLNNRVVCAKWLWERTGETKDVLKTCREALASAESYAAQVAPQVLQEMGQEARPDVPALKAALWHKDFSMRERAGEALRKIAPEEMPLIR